MNRFLLAAVLGAICSAFAGAADPALRVDMGSTPSLNNMAGIVNKNMALKNNNVAITSSNVATVNDDTISLEQATGELPPGVTLPGQDEPVDDPEALTAEGGDGQEQFRPRPRSIRRSLFCYRRGPISQCGWRYPIAYWNRRGRFTFGSSCRFGQSFGSFYYC